MRLEAWEQGGRVGSFCRLWRRICSMALFLLLGVCWPPLWFLGFCCITLTSAFIFTWRSPCVCIQISPFYKDTSCIELGTHPTALWPHLNLLREQLSFLKSSHSEVLAVRTSTYEYGRNTIQRITTHDSKWIRKSIHDINAISLYLWWTELRIQVNSSWYLS